MLKRSWDRFLQFARSVRCKVARLAACHTRPGETAVLLRGAPKLSAIQDAVWYFRFNCRCRAAPGATVGPTARRPTWSRDQTATVDYAIGDTGRAIPGPWVRATPPLIEAMNLQRAPRFLLSRQETIEAVP
jgi:hypothetical protein